MRVPRKLFNEMNYSAVPSLTVAREGEGRRPFVLMGNPITFVVSAPGGPPRAGTGKDVRASGYIRPWFQWKFEWLDKPAEEETTDVAPA